LRLTRVQTLIVVASSVLTALVALVFAQLSPPVYNTSRSVIVLSGSNPNDNDVLSRALESIVKSKGMAAEIKRRGDLPQSIDSISGKIGTRRSPESPYMDIVVSSPTKAESEQISAQVIPALRGVFEANQREIPVEQRIPGPVFQEVFSKPLQQTSKFPAWFAAVFGALLGGLVPYLFFLFRNMRKPVVSSAQDVTEAIDLPILVKVPSLSGRGSNPQDAVAGVISAVERLSLNEPIHRLVLVGADDGADRAQLALALACVIARSFGQPVALVDADLEHGILTDLVHAEDVAGLSECLSGQLDPDKALLTLSDAQLPANLDGLRAPEGMVRFLGAGVDRSRNILRMRSTFHRVLEGMAGRYVVIINGPKVPGPVPTSQLLSLADATLMVVAEGQTSLTDARSAGDTLRSFSSGPAGVVVLRR
jgi:Mrp family chromosome partitioning ATPase